MSGSLAVLITEQADQICIGSKGLALQLDAVPSTPEREEVLRSVLKALMEIKDRIFLEIQKLQQPAESV